MDKAVTAAVSVRGVSAAQAGKLLCVSETIYPHGPRQGMSLIHGDMSTAGRLRPPSCARMAGGEFVDLRDLVSASGPARRASRQEYGGGAVPRTEGDERR